ncbi:HAD family hydrolase [Halarcobacter sp.]|uniref:HAD family hydrolase n=1 Tax=Halarcobacter sp. TaxID=2321133 RepID=UPI002AA6F835|nr:HAD family hydrolase [Halarcobacter sp.]
MSKKAVIFDMDGTLLDSLKDIAVCANIVLEEFKLPTHELADYKNFVGGGVQVLLENCTPNDISEVTLKEVIVRFKEVYDSSVQNETKPYEGINELLRLLQERNIKMGILSNKPHDLTVKYYKKFFEVYNIDEVHGQKENIPKKPHPIAAINISEKIGLECKNILFVGDSDVDIQTAKNAGMISVGVSWGFRGVDELIENGADFIVKTPLEILELLE